MLRRLGFTGRLMAIVLLALLALWAVGVGWVFVTETREEIASILYPLPEQVAAIVDLIDATEQSRWSSVIRAVNSDNLRVTVSQERPADEAGARRLPVVELFLARYLAILQPREVVATMERSDVPRWRELRLGQYWLYARQPLRLSVSLRSGGFATFETRGLIVRRLFGLPPGFTVGAVGALVGIAAIIAIAREARPLRLLAESVERFTADARFTPIASSGAPEIQKLIEAINAMQARIIDLVKARALLLGAISHDLKTYITRLRLRVEQLPVDEQREKAARDLDDMTRLIEDALALSRGTFVSARRESVDVCDLLTNLLADYPPDRVRFRLISDEAALHVKGEPVALRRLFANLIDNALRFATICEVELARRSEYLVVTVDDNGPGIPPGEREAVLEPFYRLEGSRNRTTGGSGLGLAIVKQIAEAHGGSIAIDVSPQQGTRVTFTLLAVQKNVNSVSGAPDPDAVIEITGLRNPCSSLSPSTGLTEISSPLMRRQSGHREHNATSQTD
jgi:signal transduction histidine kinase